MVLGLPETVAHRPTFYWEKQVTFAEHDSSDNPWDWSTAPTLENTPEPQQVICAYEFSAPFGRTGAIPERAGEFNISTLTFTVLEEEFSVLAGTSSGFSYVTVGPKLNRKWHFRFWQPTVGLNDLQVYQITCAAEDT
jgi:hypothetical protein